MADIKTPHRPLFLREEELRYSIELMFFAYRDFTSEGGHAPSAGQFRTRASPRSFILSGAIRHQCARFVKHSHITKQSLSRVLSHLIDTGYVRQKQGSADKTPNACSI